MKAYTLLLFALLSVCNFAVAQQDDTKQKINQIAKEGSTITLDSVETFESDFFCTELKRHSVQKFIYGESLRLAEIVETVLGIDNSEKITNKTVFKYNNNGLVDSIFFWNIFQEKPTLEKFWLNVMEYDNQGRTKTLYHYRYYNSTWNPYQNFLFRYGDDGLLEEIRQTEGISSLVSSTTLHEFVYDKDKMIKEVLKNDAIDYLNFIIENNYDVSGKLKSTVVDHVGSYFSQLDYSYNPDGRIYEADYSSILDSKSSQFRFSSLDRSRLVNIPFDLLRFNLNDAWDYWDYSYTQRGIYHLAEAFSSYLSLPAVFSVDQEVKNGSLISEVIHEHSNSFSFIEGYRSFQEKMVFCYSSNKKGTVTGIEKAKEFDVEVFPNPASDHITFNWKQGSGRLTLKLFQITGSAVMDKNISKNEVVSLKRLPSGIYFYKLFDRNEILNSGKFVIK